MRAFKLILLLIPIIWACEKPTIYEVDTLQVYSDGGEKINRKTSSEFISIAFADLFGSAPTAAELSNFNLVYEAFGDPEFIEDLIVRNLINDPRSDIPSQSEMKADPESFVQEAYLSLYNRPAQESEVYFLREYIESTPDLLPTTIYYGMMTSEEYRYY